jgi:hypothetical protein
MASPALAQSTAATGKALPVSAAASAEEAQPLAGPCYLRFTGTGRTTALCDPAAPVYQDLATLHISVAPDEPTPNIHLLRYSHHDQMTYFDRECNRQRYARTDFTCGSGSIWYQDSRDQWVSLTRVCTDGSCQKDGGPCRTSSDCCPGNNCHPMLKTCKSLKKEVPQQPSPSQTQ